MRFTVYTSGTRGDVQPFIPLAQGLHRAGHRVRLATGSNFQNLIEQAGIDFAPVELDYNEIMASPEIQTAFESGGVNILFVMLKLFPRVIKMVDQALVDAWRASAETDAILFTANGPWGFHIAEALRVPAVRVCFQPLARSWQIPNVVVMSRPHRLRFINWITHIAFELVTWLPLRGHINRWRQHVLNLPPLSFKPPYSATNQSLLAAYSPVVSPRPDDWPEAWQVVGFWLTQTPTSWQPPSDLIAFLEAGPPPVYLGFGSMFKRDATPATRLVLQALGRAGQRGILLRGWHSLAECELPANVFTLDSAPHAWLFPRMAAIVHHGGSGTTAAGLCSGVPSIVVPHGADQSFWGQRVYELGVGPTPIPYRVLTAEKLATAIETALANRVIRERAEAIGEKIRAEDGVENAIQEIGSVVNTHRPGTVRYSAGGGVL